MSRNTLDKNQVKKAWSYKRNTPVKSQRGLENDISIALLLQNVNKVQDDSSRNNKF
jgi:hypothetical protein